MDMINQVPQQFKSHIKNIEIHQFFLKQNNFENKKQRKKLKKKGLSDVKDLEDDNTPLN